VREETGPLEPSRRDRAGVLMIVSGPSGVGKSTVCRRLAERLDALLSVSMTTRPRRPDEVDGEAYWFVSHDEFRRRIDEGRMLEYAEVYGGHLTARRPSRCWKPWKRGEPFFWRLRSTGRSR